MLIDLMHCKKKKLDSMVIQNIFKETIERTTLTWVNMCSDGGKKLIFSGDDCVYPQTY